MVCFICIIKAVPESEPNVFREHSDLSYHELQCPLRKRARYSPEDEPVAGPSGLQQQQQVMHDHFQYISTLPEDQDNSLASTVTVATGMSSSGSNESMPQLDPIPEAAGPLVSCTMNHQTADGNHLKDGGPNEYQSTKEVTEECVVSPPPYLTALDLSVGMEVVPRIDMEVAKEEPCGNDESIGYQLLLILKIIPVTKAKSSLLIRPYSDAVGITLSYLRPDCDRKPPTKKRSVSDITNGLVSELHKALLKLTDSSPKDANTANKIALICTLKDFFDFP